MAEKDSVPGDDMRATNVESSLSIDEVFRLLGHERRRLALCCLADGDGPMSLTDLAAAVAARERGTARADLTTTDVTQTYLSLFHVHVPTLEEADIVTFCQDTGTVEPVGLARFRPYLQSGPDGTTEVALD